jgi:hypothetical protein
VGGQLGREPPRGQPLCNGRGRLKLLLLNP